MSLENAISVLFLLTTYAPMALAGVVVLRALWSGRRVTRKRVWFED